MSMLICPVCASALSREDKRYVCAQGHGFDCASSGYVNLLLPNQKHSQSPGDDKSMVRARADFLGRDYYRVLREALCALCLEHTADGSRLLDSGCGEGYYTAAVREALHREGRQVEIAGIDISKNAVQLAAKKAKSVTFAVASAHRLPVADHSVDLLWSCFSPVAGEEFWRVLKPRGLLVLVQPAARHLWDLKAVLYDKPYENTLNTYDLPGFLPVRSDEVRDTVTLATPADIHNLFLMTPYYWKTPAAGSERLLAMETLRTEIAFRIDVFLAKDNP